MKRIKALSVLFTALFMLAALGGCGSTPSSTVPSASVPAPSSAAPSTPGAPTGFTVFDMTGREIAFEAPAARIVSITPSDCEILYALGAGDTLVGRGTYCDYPEDVLALPDVGSASELNIEQVLALQPDLVIMPTMAQTVQQVQALEDAGVKVVVSDAQSIEGVYEAIGLIGAVTGKDVEAEALVDSMVDSFAAIGNRATAGGGKTIYFEVSPLEHGLWTTGRNTFMDELATLLGLTNAFADVDGWGDVSQEQVIERDPDYIITIAMYFGEGPTPEDEILGRDGWQDMTAIQNGAVFNADNNEISRPGPRLVDAAEALYEFVYVTMADYTTAAA